MVISVSLVMSVVLSTTLLIKEKKSMKTKTAQIGVYLLKHLIEQRQCQVKHNNQKSLKVKFSLKQIKTAALLKFLTKKKKTITNT